MGITPSQLKALRLSLGLSASQFAGALGYGGSKAARGNMVYAWESGSKPIPLTLEYRLAWLRANTEKATF